jgi:wyosine [tRNA(Phe)-imidazoG37] synthetase (radical SAM superfamily)
MPTKPVSAVYGPLPSRRLGRSLGIDPIPLKTCNWNCVYCQLGRSTPLVNERREWVSTEAILAEVETVLATAAPDSIDWVTFVGSGEPLLHSEIGRMIRSVKQMTSIPVGLITNGALFFVPEVRGAVLDADAIMPTLSAGSAELYRTIHRPHPAVTFDRHVAGLIALRDEYEGQLWLELMLLAGLNDSEEALQDISRTVAQIQPDTVHITLPTRPPSETWVALPEADAIERAVSILGSVAHIVVPRNGQFVLANANPVKAIVELVARHPIDDAQLDQIVEGFSAEIERDIRQKLLVSGQVRRVQRHGKWFWCHQNAGYPDSDYSEKVHPHPL